MRFILLTTAACLSLALPTASISGGLGSAFSAAIKKAGPDLSDAFRGSRGQPFKWESPYPSRDLGPRGSNGTPSVAKPLYPGLPSVHGGMPKQ